MKKMVHNDLQMGQINPWEWRINGNGKGEWQILTMLANISALLLGSWEDVILLPLWTWTWPHDVPMKCSTYHFLMGTSKSECVSHLHGKLQSLLLRSWHHKTVEHPSAWRPEWLQWTPLSSVTHTGYREWKRSGPLLFKATEIWGLFVTAA